MESCFALPSVDSPKLLIRTSALVKHPELARRLLRQYRFKHHQHVFYEPLIIDALFRIDAISSYLSAYEVKSTDPGLPSVVVNFLASNHLLAQLFSRSRSTMTATDFDWQEDAIVVRKWLTQGRGGSDASPPGEAVLASTEPWRPGVPEEEILEQMCLTGNWDGLGHEVVRFIRHVFANFGRPDGKLQESSIDAIPRNATNDQGRLYFFDLEFSHDVPVEKSFVVLRICIHLFGGDRWLLQASPFESTADMYLKLCGMAGIPANLARDLDEENRFMNRVLARRGGHLTSAKLARTFQQTVDEQDVQPKMRRYRALLRTSLLVNIALIALLLIVTFVL